MVENKYPVLLLQDLGLDRALEERNWKLWSIQKCTSVHTLTCSRHLPQGHYLLSSIRRFLWCRGPNYFTLLAELRKNHFLGVVVLKKEIYRKATYKSQKCHWEIYKKKNWRQTFPSMSHQLPLISGTLFLYMNTLFRTTEAFRRHFSWCQLPNDIVPLRRNQLARDIWNHFKTRVKITCSGLFPKRDART